MGIVSSFVFEPLEIPELVGAELTMPETCTRRDW